MDRQRTLKLAARFIAEAEADINYGLAEDLDPHREYASLIARLHGKQVVGSRPSPELFEDESRMDIVHDLASSHDGIDSPALQPLAEFRFGL